MKIHLKVHVVRLHPQNSLWTSYFMSKMDVQKPKYGQPWDVRRRRLKAVAKGEVKFHKFSSSLFIQWIHL